MCYGWREHDLIKGKRTSVASGSLVGGAAAELRLHRALQASPKSVVFILRAMESQAHRTSGKSAQRGTSEINSAARLLSSEG